MAGSKAVLPSSRNPKGRAKVLCKAWGYELRTQSCRGHVPPRRWRRFWNAVGSM